VKRRLRIILGFALLNFVIYPFGMLLAGAFLIMCQLKYVRVTHWERFPHFKQRIILVANHPSMLDPFLISALFFRGYLLHPLKYGPLIVADKSNFYDSWYWFWLRPFLIPVERGNKRAEAISFLRIKKAIDQGRVIIIFPEGGRTCRGTVFLRSKKRKKIRVLRKGVALLVAKTRATVVPVWIDGSEKFLPNSMTERLFTRLRFPKKKSIQLKIGEPIHFGRGELQQISAKEEIMQVIANSLLQLADEDV